MKYADFVTTDRKGNTLAFVVMWREHNDLDSGIHTLDMTFKKVGSEREAEFWKPHSQTVNPRYLKFYGELYTACIEGLNQAIKNSHDFSGEKKDLGMMYRMTNHELSLRG